MKKERSACALSFLTGDHTGEKSIYPRSLTSLRTGEGSLLEGQGPPAQEDSSRLMNAGAGITGPRRETDCRVAALLAMTGRRGADPGRNHRFLPALAANAPEGPLVQRGLRAAVGDWPSGEGQMAVFPPYKNSSPKKWAAVLGNGSLLSGDAGPRRGRGSWRNRRTLSP